MEIKYYHQLYFGSSLVNKEKRGIIAFLNKLLKKEQTDNEKKLVKEFETLELDKSIYVLTVSSNEFQRLEFYKTHYLKQEFFNDATIFVVGFAHGYDEARELVKVIMEDTLIKTQGYQIKNLLRPEAFTTR